MRLPIHVRRNVPEPSRDSSMTCRCGAMFLWCAWINGKVVWYWCELCDEVEPKRRKRLSK